MFSGKSILNFVIMDKKGENSMCKLNTSVQFCKMSIDYLFEPVDQSQDYLVTLFLEGEAVADARGQKRDLKQRVSDAAVECLSKICYTVILNDDGGQVRLYLH